MIIIGSHAIKHFYPDFPREPKDLDYACKQENPQVKIVPDNMRVEYLYNPVITKYVGEEEVYLNPDLLLTLKASHLFWDINWDKHMFDVQFLLKNGHTINRKIFYELYDFWNEYHSKNKRSDLNKSKEDFFTNAINYDEHEHDELHLLINPVPMYTMLLAEGKEVELDENKFYPMTHRQKCAVVYEETMVMAYERYKKLGYLRAYSRMLKKFIREHAPMYVALFAIE